jgi:hypothetical protein
MATYRGSLRCADTSIPVVCNYDSSKFGASVAPDIMRTHLLVTIADLLHETPFIVPPNQVLDEMRERRSLRTGS